MSSHLASCHFPSGVQVQQVVTRCWIVGNTGMRWGLRTACKEGKLGALVLSVGSSYKGHVVAVGELKKGDKSPSMGWESQVSDTCQAETLDSHWCPHASDLGAPHAFSSGGLFHHIKEGIIKEGTAMEKQWLGNVKHLLLPINGFLPVPPPHTH